MLISTIGAVFFFFFLFLKSLQSFAVSFMILSFLEYYRCFLSTRFIFSYWRFRSIIVFRICVVFQDVSSKIRCHFYVVLQILDCC